MSWDEAAFIEKLEGNHTFPGEYVFKFIVKPDQKEKVISLVKDAEIKLKPSSGNKYISVTIISTMANSAEVVEVYKEAKKIEGIISL